MLTILPAEQLRSSLPEIRRLRGLMVQLATHDAGFADLEWMHWDAAEKQLGAAIDNAETAMRTRDARLKETP